MEIVNNTSYTKDAVLAFQRFNARLLKKIPWSTYAFFAVLTAVVVAGIAFMLFIRSWFNIALLALALGLIARRYYVLYIGPARKFDQSSFKDLAHRYEFRKQSFSVVCGGEEAKHRYEQAAALYDTPAALYLYFGRGQAFIVQKDGFERPADAQAVKKRFLEAIGEKRCVTLKR